MDTNEQTWEINRDIAEALGWFVAWTAPELVGYNPSDEGNTLLVLCRPDGEPTNSFIIPEWHDPSYENYLPESNPEYEVWDWHELVWAQDDGQALTLLLTILNQFNERDDNRWRLEFNEEGVRFWRAWSTVGHGRYENGQTSLHMARLAYQMLTWEDL